MNLRYFFLSLILVLAVSCGQKAPPPEAAAPPVPFSLDELQKRTFDYFWDLADTVNYQIPDRYPTLTFSSIAATGFGLTSYLVGVERGYITREQAAERVQKTLQILWDLPQGPDEEGVSGYKGLFYHFLTLDKALRFKQVELSTIDTGLLMAGVLSAMTYFDQDTETEQSIRQLADALYRRVEWDWALTDSMRLSMGYHPEKGFIQNDWHGYNEAMILILMAIGSPTHSIPAEGWQSWCDTYQWATFQGQEHLNFAPLFGHQYSHMYIDFREIQDPYMKAKGIDYFENSRRATLANRAYCIENPGGFIGYGENIWGLTACDGPANDKHMWNGREIQFRTYWARGASAFEINDDGTITPTAAGGSVPFAPEVCIPALQAMWEEYYDQLVDDYGFRDAFNPTYTFGEGNENGWFDVDYIGIDQGPILIQIENHRSGFVWDLMKRNPYIVEGLKKAGFTGGWLDAQNQ
jgi:hypothetical protein